MEKSEYRRDYLILDFGAKFSDDLKASLLAFTDEEKVDVLELLFESAKRLERKEDYDTIYHSCIDPILTKYKSKSSELFDRKLTDYFIHDSYKLIDLMHEKKINDFKNQHLTDEEYKSFMWMTKNLLFNERHFTYRRMSAETSNTEIVVELVEKNKEFTAKRRALFLHYLDKHFHIAKDKQPLAEIARFLTGMNESNLYHHLLNPLETSNSKNPSQSEKALKKDLICVKRLFERLELKEIVKTIDKDFDSI